MKATAPLPTVAPGTGAARPDARSFSADATDRDGDGESRQPTQAGARVSAATVGSAPQGAISTFSAAQRRGQIS